MATSSTSLITTIGGAIGLACKNGLSYCANGSAGGNYGGGSASNNNNKSKPVVANGHTITNIESKEELFSRSQEQATQTETPRSKNEAVARDLSMDIVLYVSHSPHCCRKPSKYAKTLRRTVEEITKRHDILFVNIIDRFQINKETGRESFSAIAEEMLSDGQVNWGRIVTVYALGAHFARYSAENNMEEYVDEVAQFLGDYVADKLGGWITENGGWDAFCTFFPEKPNVEDKLWNGLWVAVAGLGAMAALAAIR